MLSRKEEARWIDGSEVQIHLFRPKALMPEKSTNYATGWDLFAAVEDNVVIRPGETVIIPLGFNISFSPHCWDVQIRSRSGLSAKGLVVANSPATIDADYSGLGEDYEMKVILRNTNHVSKAPAYKTEWEAKSFIIHPGMKIAQMIIQEHREEPVLVSVAKDQFVVSTGDRVGGLGSTGV